MSEMVGSRVAHPMPGWIAVIPIPEPDPKACVDCGLVHEQGAQHGQAVTEIPGVGLVIGGAPPSARTIVAAVVVEAGEPHEQVAALPYGAGATVYFTSDHGIVVGDAVYLGGHNVIAWDDGA